MAGIEPADCVGTGLGTPAASARYLAVQATPSSDLATGQCPGLADSTSNAAAYWSKFSQASPHLIPILTMYADGDAETFLAFLLDPSIQAPVLSLAGHLGSFVVDELCHRLCQ